MLKPLTVNPLTDVKGIFQCNDKLGDTIVPFASSSSSSAMSMLLLLLPFAVMDVPILPKDDADEEVMLIPVDDDNDDDLPPPVEEEGDDDEDDDDDDDIFNFISTVSWALVESSILPNVQRAILPASSYTVVPVEVENFVVRTCFGNGIVTATSSMTERKSFLDGADDECINDDNDLTLI